MKKILNKVVFLSVCIVYSDAFALSCKNILSTDFAITLQNKSLHSNASDPETFINLYIQIKNDLNVKGENPGPYIIAQTLLLSKKPYDEVLKFFNDNFPKDSNKSLLAVYLKIQSAFLLKKPIREVDEFFEIIKSEYKNNTGPLIPVMAQTILFSNLPKNEIINIFDTKWKLPWNRGNTYYPITIQTAILTGTRIEDVKKSFRTLLIPRFAIPSQSTAGAAVMFQTFYNATP